MFLKVEILSTQILILFAILGIGSRIGLDSLSEVLALYNWNFGSSFPSLLSNCVGCFILGYFSKMRKLWFDQKSLPMLYTGISTGFCGSLTTFSGWLYASSWVFTNTIDTRP